jgi:spore coat protein CotH
VRTPADGWRSSLDQVACNVRKLLVLLALTACTGSSIEGVPFDAAPLDGEPPDRSSTLFDPDHVLEVAIELDPAEWDMLRTQSRSWVSVFTRCGEHHLDPFTYFRGAVTIDGRRVDDVGVRKKGFLGSLSVSKPSLKLKLDEYVDDQELHGLSKITLNNAVQDPAYVRQCLAYRTFAAANVPAPRCNFARVRVNGADLGLYVHVETVGKPFLRRHFDDDGGNLYEGTLADFRDGWTANLDLKTNEDENDRSDVERVIAALEQSDTGMIGALGDAVDLDALLRFWAAEVLVTHWDSYSGNANNYFAYHDPTSDRFHFIPWGTDNTFLPGPDPFRDGIASTRAVSLMPRRLYGLPDVRARYAEVLRELLTTAWDETAMLAEIDRMAALITPIADPDGSANLAARLEEVRASVRERRAEIEAELDAGPPDWTAPLRDIPCAEKLGAVSGQLETTFGTTGGDAFASGTGVLTGAIQGVPIQADEVGATSGWDPDIQPPAPPVVQVAGLARVTDGTYRLLTLRIDPGKLVAGTSAPIDWVDVVGILHRFDPGAGWTLVGLVGDGTLQVLAGGTNPGDPIRVWFSGGTVIRQPW